MKRLNIALLLLSISLLLISCEDDSPIAPKPSVFSFGPDNGITSEIAFSYNLTGIDPNNIIGGIDIENLNQSLLNNEMTLLLQNTYLAKIKFFGRNDSSYAFENSYLNQQQFIEEYPGTYWARGDANAKTGLQLHFGAGNSFQLGTTAISNPIDTVVTIVAPTSLSNISAGDSISKSKDLDLQWNITPTKYVEISMMQAFPNPNSNFTIYANCYLDNNGRYTFPSSQLKNFPKGMYQLTITNWVPYYLFDNIGRVVIVTFKSQNTKTIIIKD